MKRNEIIRLAREAGIVWDDHTVVGSRENLLERFAALVIDAELRKLESLCDAYLAEAKSKKEEAE
jgi:hypothetical protein